MDELGTRIVPWDPCEVEHARNRPHAERTPLPSVGDEVFYRRNNWDTDLIRAVVVEVQDLDDRADPNLWAAVKDVDGRTLYDPAGMPVWRRQPDPWPWLHLSYQPSGVGEAPRLVRTWEARLRGSAGWLPPNWADLPHRWRLPAQTRLVTQPPLTAVRG